MIAALHLTKKDFRIDWFSGTGGGGQHRNKHQNCCRITHIETGLRAQGTEFRERPRNQALAFRRLASLILAYRAAPPGRRRLFDTAHIRTYHEPRNEVLDHASGARMTYKEVVGKNNIGPLIEARKNNLETTE